jgi:thioredoxin reductase (NADPH)
MEERVRKTENIEILMNHDTIEVLGDEQVVTGVRALKNTDEVFDIEATGFFVALVINPIQIFLKTLTLDETGYIVNVPGTSKTNVGGVLLAVMLRIMCIVRQLLLLVQAAWPLWMQSDICLQKRMCLI